VACTAKDCFPANGDEKRWSHLISPFRRPIPVQPRKLEKALTVSMLLEKGFFRLIQESETREHIVGKPIEEMTNLNEKIKPTEA
jgi:hypothetical protein